jgi:hypothetical protein
MCFPRDDCSLLIGNCSHLEEVCPARLHCCSRVDLVPCHKDIIDLSFLDSKVAVGENGSEQRTEVQNGGRDVKLFSYF